MTQPERRKRPPAPGPWGGDEAVEETLTAQETPSGGGEKSVRLILVGAGSYTGLQGGRGTVRKGRPFDADAEEAARLLRTGLFKEA